LRASSAVIAVSESTKKDIENHYDLSDRPVHVVYQGYRDDVFVPASPGRVKEIKAKYRLDSYILSVGETRPYKNIRRLIRAFAGVPIPGLKLALAGKINRLDRSLLELPGELGISGKVTFLDYVPDEELAALYSGAVAFIFPSLYEGFGIPPLEAMACGCPVIASKVASLPEVCGEAAVYVDPCDNDSIAGGIFKTANDKQLQDTLRQKGLERVKSFSYREAAEKLVKILYEYSG
jgi:glycosyltransferase involved in cell wall biosynthesis